VTGGWCCLYVTALKTERERCSIQAVAHRRAVLSFSRALRIRPVSPLASACTPRFLLLLLTWCSFDSNCFIQCEMIPRGPSTHERLLHPSDLKGLQQGPLQVFIGRCGCGELVFTCCCPFHPFPSTSSTKVLHFTLTKPLTNMPESKYTAATCGTFKKGWSLNQNPPGGGNGMETSLCVRLHNFYANPASPSVIVQR
jgi:hypothetical protein